MEAVIRIPFKSAKDAGSALKILESEKIERERSKIIFKTEAATLTIRISASDVAALRAAMNTYLRLAGVILAGQEA